MDQNNPIYMGNMVLDAYLDQLKIEITQLYELLELNNPSNTDNYNNYDSLRKKVFKPYLNIEDINFLNEKIKYINPKYAVFKEDSDGIVDSDDKLDELWDNVQLMLSLGNQSCASQCMGGCLGSCSIQCADYCGQSCEGFCDEGCLGGCQDNCALHCIGQCFGSCAGKCQGWCYGTCNDACRSSEQIMAGKVPMDEFWPHY